MRIACLLYHDVVEGNDWDCSGFRGGDSNVYKLPRVRFREHLAAIDGIPAGTRVLARPSIWQRQQDTVLLTFDDGGAGAYLWTADLLEEHGWRGHFFIPTDLIGNPGFMTAPQFAELHRRGHVIGSHSASHPPRLSRLDPASIRREWTESIARLSDLLGEPVDIASVPGGFYSRRVAMEAAAAGIRVLFNSEPVTDMRRVGDCLVLGRLGLMRSSPPAKAAQLAAFNCPLIWREYIFWNAKKALKMAGGQAWLSFRKAALASR